MCSTTLSILYKGIAYKGFFLSSTEALFSEWRHCYLITAKGFPVLKQFAKTLILDTKCTGFHLAI